MVKRKVTLFLMWLFVIATLVGCSTEANQISVPITKQDVFIYDQGDFLDDTVEEKVNNMLVQLEEKTTIEFAVITIPSLNSMTIEDYAMDLGNELGIGKKEEDNGILLLISKEDTKVRLEIGNGLQGILTDSMSGKILDNFFVPHRSDGNYDDAVLETVQAVINVLATSEEYSSLDIKGINPDLIVEPTPGYYYVILLLIIIVALIVIEGITGHIFGDGFGNGLVSAIFTSSGSSSGRGFGGGGFSGGGASR